MARTKANAYSKYETVRPDVAGRTVNCCGQQLFGFSVT